MPYKPKIITVRMSPEQHLAVKAAANAKGCSLNQYCLYMLLGVIPTLPPEKKDCKGDNNV